MLVFGSSFSRDVKHFIAFLFEIGRDVECLVPDGLEEMTLPGIDDGMPEEADEVVCHNDERVAGFRRPKVL